VCFRDARGDFEHKDSGDYLPLDWSHPVMAKPSPDRPTLWGSGLGAIGFGTLVLPIRETRK
jgi:hypothetical protein